MSYKVTGVVREGHASGGSVPFSYPAGKAKKSSSYLVGRFSSRVCFARMSRANGTRGFLMLKKKGTTFGTSFRALLGVSPIAGTTATPETESHSSAKEHSSSAHGLGREAVSYGMGGAFVMWSKDDETAFVLSIAMAACMSERDHFGWASWRESSRVCFARMSRAKLAHEVS